MNDIQECLRGEIVGISDILTLQFAHNQEDVRHLFAVLEIWGLKAGEMPLVTDSMTSIELVARSSLSEKRMAISKSLKKLVKRQTLLIRELKEVQKKIIVGTQVTCSQIFPLDSFISQFERFARLMRLVRDYFVSKDTEQPHKGLLFTSNHEPHAHLVGHLIQVNQGHTREFVWKEEAQLNMHLTEAGIGGN